MGYDEYRRDSGDNISTRLTYLLIGGGIGAILALLFAPKSGQELRGDIADATRKGIDRSREAAQQLGDRAGEYYEATRARAGELYSQAAERVGEVAQNAREAAAREVETLLQSSQLLCPDRGSDTERQLCDDLDHFYVTDAADRFAKVAERFLGTAPSVLEAVEVWGHDELRTK